MRRYAFIGLTFIVLGVVLASCGGGTDKSKTKWNLPAYDKTGVVPQNVTYQFEPSQPMASDQKVVFAVIDSSGKRVAFTYNNGTYQHKVELPIDEGTFFHIWGSLLDDLIQGNHFPVDSCAISGHFVSPTKVEGTIKLASSGRITYDGTFVATLQ